MLSARIIAPNERGRIRVLIDTHDLSASTFQRRILIESNDPIQPKVDLILKGTLEPEMTLSRNSIYLSDAIRSAEVLITSRQRNNRALVAQTTDPSLKASIDLIDSSPNGRYRLVVHYTALSGDLNYHYAKVLISTSSPLLPEIVVPVRIVASGEIVTEKQNEHKTKQDKLE